MTGSATTTTPLSPELSRSWLLVSARQSHRFDTVHKCGADQVILDIEDAVDPSHKDAARTEVVRWLSEGGRAWVRINDHSTAFWKDDVQALRGAAGLLGVVLAKTETPDAVSETHDMLGEAVPVVALIESALGIEESVSIARAPGATRLAFGSGDYRRDTGASADEIAMAYPRSRLVAASRIGGLPGPIDGPTVNPSHTALRDQSNVSVSLGMTGKLCLFSEQSDVVNESFSPSPSDVRWAREFLAEFDSRGGVINDGSDLPRLQRARRIEFLAEAFAASSR